MSSMPGCPPMQLRAKLEEMVVHDLLGPAGGPKEELSERNVRDRYLIGVLAPPQHGGDAGASSPTGVDDEDEETPHIPDQLPRAGRIPWRMVGLTATRCPTGCSYRRRSG